MRVLGASFIVFLLIGSYFFFSESKVPFSKYKYRKPAQTSELMAKNQESAEKPTKTDSAPATSSTAQVLLKPLDSRRISAQVFKEANHDQKVEEVSLGGKDYFLSKNMFAVAKRDWDESDPAIVTEFLGHYIVEGHGPADISQPVLISKATSKYAIVTKVLKVKYYSGEAPLIFSMPFSIVDKYPHITLYLYRFDSLEDLSLAYDEARSYSGIRRATIEVLEGARIGL